MTAPDLSRLVAAGLLLLPALAWGSMAHVAGHNALRRLRGEPVIWVVTALMALVALYFLAGALLAVLPPDAGSRPPLGRSTLAALRDVCVVVGTALSYHVVPLSSVWGEGPGAAWIGVNYGLAALVAAIAVLPGLIPTATPAERWLASRAVVLIYVVLINLVENALDALGQRDGGRRLAIAVGGDDGRATLRVADNGPGVPADALPHLFEPFFSLKATGTGLGLAIVRRTVEAHGGRIEATSPAGTGMTFHIALPLTAAAGLESRR